MEDQPPMKIAVDLKDKSNSCNKHIGILDLLYIGDSRPSKSEANLQQISAWAKKEASHVSHFGPTQFSFFGPCF